MEKHPARLAAAALLAALLATASPATASTQPYESFRLSEAAAEALTSPQYDRCMDASEGRTAPMRDCAAAEGERLDARLNASYRAAMARLPDRESRIRLRDLERGWLATRWDACEREAAPEKGGTLWLLIMDDCGIGEMRRRIAWVERYGR